MTSCADAAAATLKMAIASSADAPDSSFIGALRQALQPNLLARSLFASAIIWLLMASAMPSYAWLIFRGQLAGYFAAGLAIALVSEIVVVLFTALFSSDHATQVVPQSPTVVIQGLIAATVVEALPAELPAEELFLYAFLSVALSSLLAGGFLILLGLFRAGGLIRYIPYPIVGGFMAGLGWLIFEAGFRVLVSLRLNAGTLPLFFESEVFTRWLPALVFALCILGLRSRIKSTLVMPGLIIVFILLFYLWANLIVGDINMVIEADRLLPNVSNALLWTLPDFSLISTLDPAIISASAGHILSLTVVLTLNLFLRAGAQELIVKRELDFNRECIVNGAGNAISALVGGGVAAYHGPISVSLVHGMRVNGRLVGIILAIMFALTLLVGGAIFSLIPRFIPAGLLMFFGLQFMKEWLLDSWSKLPRKDYIIVALLALSIAFFGMLTGIALGIWFAVAIFVLEYSRMNVIKQEFSGAAHRSNVDRSFAQNRHLQREGERIWILRLQGFIFFGSAYRFCAYVRSRIAAGDAASQRYIILDFKAVSGLDVSASMDFRKLKEGADARGVSLLLCSAAPHLRPLLEAGKLIKPESEQPALFNDLDHALEYCERSLLAEADLLHADRVTVAEQLARHEEVRPEDASAVAAYLERLETTAEQIIIEQGDPADALYFIESGRVDVLLRRAGEPDLRLRSMTAGAVIGEIGYYLGSARTAAIVVTEAGILQRLSHESLREMEVSAPQTASAVHVLIASLLSDRLTTSNRLLRQLMD